MDTALLINQISTPEWIVIGIYFIAFTIQILFYLVLFRKLYVHTANSNKDENPTVYCERDLPGVSVIITAKDEAENLRKNLLSILNQNYPKFQVIVVDNASTDTSQEALEEFQKDYPNLYVTFVPIDSKAKNNKKLAITLGIKAAQYDILLFTEPDSKPLSDNWIYEYAKVFDENTDIVLGCCQLDIAKNFFKRYILLDNLFCGIKYTSMALSRKPYMGIGRNMAFKKQLFFNNKGFSSILNINNGEDDLFINRVATKDNTAIVSTANSMVVNASVNGLLVWKNIKYQYLTTRKYYKGIKTKLLSFEVFSRYLFYLVFALLIYRGITKPMLSIALYSLLLFVIRYIVQLIVINKNSKIYNAGVFCAMLPFYDILAPIANRFFMRNKLA